MARTASPSWRDFLPRFERGAMALFALTLALSALVGDRPLGAMLRVQPGALLSGAGLWQPFTANFVFPGDGVGLVIGTLFSQWLFGSDLERFWGTRRYVTLVLSAGTAGYLAYALVSPWLPELEHGGSSGFDLAAIAAYGVVFAKRELSLFGAATFRGRTLAIILVLLGLIGPVMRGASWTTPIPWLISVGIALLVTTQPWRRRGDRDGTTRKPRGKAKPSHLKVVPKELLN
ncbi:MAG: rhomboid family intramembrane serine protease [Deltaproteobacteria bacterium]|nr:rhomboid family intramembrane serine protease [Deltaproteobacteria bacterium]MBK8715444.1 rhomboid family intramembrane serine protease [Deltaproteobacteria bacterium]MBP7287668.1 rhomboid family intramembrane serine protease [Nannocystaceae bacterium]